MKIERLGKAQLVIQRRYLQPVLSQLIFAFCLCDLLKAGSQLQHLQPDQVLDDW